MEKDASRHRTPHFMCGSLREDESGITVFTPAPNIPLNLKKPVKDGGEALATLPDQDKRTNANNKVSDTDNKILRKFAQINSLLPLTSFSVFNIIKFSLLLQLYVMAMIQVWDLKMTRHWHLSLAKADKSQRRIVRKRLQRINH